MYQTIDPSQVEFVMPPHPIEIAATTVADAWQHSVDTAFMTDLISQAILVGLATGALLLIFVLVLRAR